MHTPSFHFPRSCLLYYCLAQVEVSRNTLRPKDPVQRECRGTRSFWYCSGTVPEFLLQSCLRVLFASCA